MARQTPVSRRERPAKPALTRDGIVDAAMAILVAEGAQALTMRRVAGELDTGPASLYVYVRNATELGALLIDRLIAALDLSWDGSEPWRDRLHRLLADYSAVLAEHSGIARSALFVWPDGPHYLDLLELLLRLLTAAGVEPEAAARATDLLLQHATAAVAEWDGRRERGEQDLDDLVQTLDSADAERHPTLKALGSAVFVRGTHEERSAWIIDVMLDGVLARGSVRAG
ncbi:TetR/AcrR family transcriptional regulator [Lentzea sp. HUAS12]|uniref:TetR/AcrR family transcriptional regulator n=1 Tax=Lentzea sp. HUAS12 TaxID=2951806 RepID=UPI00209E44DE|nr:TetR/AcrR family transcriptional regulator [Lentzea sp. HUAS12]USX53733.1 TetR/AcrR family transcriptional regulator C-terminal domain-containing protein [Lentzea sp. HUAS12]